MRNTAVINNHFLWKKLFYIFPNLKAGAASCSYIPVLVYIPGSTELSSLQLYSQAWARSDSLELVARVSWGAASAAGEVRLLSATSLFHLTDTQLDGAVDVEMLSMMSEDTGTGELSTLEIFMSWPVVLCLALAYILIGTLPFSEWGMLWIMHRKQLSVWPRCAAQLSACSSGWSPHLEHFHSHYRRLSVARDHLKPSFLPPPPWSGASKSSLIILGPHVFHHPDLLTSRHTTEN